MTIRCAGGLDFTAKGGKRQGCEVPQSLKTTRFGKPKKMRTAILEANLDLKNIAMLSIIPE
jgi:hypothetical protein